MQAGRSAARPGAAITERQHPGRGVGRRLFLAADLPPSLRDELAAYAARHPAAGVRWTPPENLHATLVFLGHVHEDALAGLVPALREVTARTPPARLEVAGTRPAPSRRPRMVWADLSPSDALSRLAADLHEAAQPFAPGIRPPLRDAGHITLARYRVRSPELSLTPLTLSEPAFRLDHVSVVHSTLGPGGAVYRTLEELPLTG